MKYTLEYQDLDDVTKNLSEGELDVVQQLIDNCYEFGDGGTCLFVHKGHLVEELQSDLRGEICDKLLWDDGIKWVRIYG